MTDPALKPAVPRHEARTGTCVHVCEDILGYGVTSASTDACIASVLGWISDRDRCHWLACLNPHSYAVALKDRRFADALRRSDLLVPDGHGIVLASRLLRGTIRRRVTGSDIFEGVMQALCQRGGGRVFFLGSTPETLRKIRERAARDYPGVEVATYSPPFKPEFTEEDDAEMIRAVAQARPDVLWVGMTAPKQELWLQQNAQRLPVPFAAAVGAVFDFYAGGVKRPSQVFQDLGLEWLPRLMQQPRRLWRRTFVSGPIFLWHTARQAAAARLRIGAR